MTCCPLPTASLASGLLNGRGFVKRAAVFRDRIAKLSAQSRSAGRLTQASMLKIDRAAAHARVVVEQMNRAADAGARQHDP